MLWKRLKIKMYITSIFSFSYNIFKRLFFWEEKSLDSEVNTCSIENSEKCIHLYSTLTKQSWIFTAFGNEAFEKIEKKILLF